MCKNERKIPCFPLVSAFSSNFSIDFLRNTGRYHQNTRVGLVMNDLRKKTSNEKLSKRIKQLIKDWKTIVETHNSGNGNGGGSGEKAEKTVSIVYMKNLVETT